MFRTYQFILAKTIENWKHIECVSPCCVLDTCTENFCPQKCCWCGLTVNTSAGSSQRKGYFLTFTYFRRTTCTFTKLQRASVKSRWRETDSSRHPARYAYTLDQRKMALCRVVLQWIARLKLTFKQSITAFRFDLIPNKLKSHKHSWCCNCSVIWNTSAV